MGCNERCAAGTVSSPLGQRAGNDNHRDAFILTVIFVPRFDPAFIWGPPRSPLLTDDRELQLEPESEPQSPARRPAGEPFSTGVFEAGAYRRKQPGGKVTLSYKTPAQEEVRTLQKAAGGHKRGRRRPPSSSSLHQRLLQTRLQATRPRLEGGVWNKQTNIKKTSHHIRRNRQINEWAQKHRCVRHIQRNFNIMGWPQDRHFGYFLHFCTKWRENLFFFLSDLHKTPQTTPS